MINRSTVIAAVILMGPAIHAFGASAPTGPVSLSCDTVNVTTKEKAPFSVVINEADRSIIVSGLAFKDAKFEPHRIEGKIKDVDPGIPGVSRETVATLDRVTGRLAFMTLPTPTHGEYFSEEQKERIATVPASAYPIFAGPCVIATPKF
jgi:hypothetical protein